MNVKTSHRSLPAPKQDFIGLGDCVHLATGGEPPLLKVHSAAFETFARDKADGMPGYARHWAVVDAVRQQVADLLQLQAGDIALIGNASEGIVKVLSSIDWRDGDNVVVSALDYASGRYALAALGEKGVAVRVIPAKGWWIDAGDLLAACDARTRVLYVSQVNALTGQHMDMALLSTTLEAAPTALLMDASHALGVVPVPGHLCDFTVAACYKFALGIHEGVLAWNQQRRPEFTPFGTGWHAANAGDNPGSYHLKADAQRAEFGNAGHLGAYLLQASLEYLADFGIAAIAVHTRRHCQSIIAGLNALDLEVMTPGDAENHGASASFRCQNTNAVVAAARADGVLLWGDNGRIRASAHLFTGDDDVAYFLAQLPRWFKT